MNLTESARPTATPAATYQLHADMVRRSLRGFGVREADLDDLCHEVFLIVHEQREQLGSVDNITYWLRAICWRLAAGYRRRAHRRLEVPAAALPEPPDEGAKANLEEIERLEERARLLDAMDTLDDRQRDLVALHDLGDLPVTELAQLLGCDRKTAHKRLTVAHRGLAKLFRERMPRRERSTPVSPRSELAEPAPPASWLSDRLQVIDVTPDVNIGLIGNAFLTTWHQAATLDAMTRLWSAITDLIESCDGRFTYLATVSAATRPPPLDARRKIVDLLKAFGPLCDAYGTALEGGLSWIARPIMIGLASLTRPRFPMKFKTGVSAAANWIAPYTRGQEGPLSPATLAAAVAHLRQLRT
jgi:RNA polymerase sigma-70 factor (ECF subfamily)